MTDIEYIAQKLSQEDILCQLAEEASELAQAALKLRRAITGTNPTPVSKSKATDDLFEELADVAVAEEAYFASISDNYRQREGLEGLVGCIVKDKGERWVQRLKDTANTNCATGTPTDVPTDTPTAGVKTRQEKFLEVFPRAIVFNGALNICPGDIDARQKCHGPKDCRDCRREYWLAAVEEDSHD